MLEVAFNDPGAIDVKALFESKGLLVDKITRTAIGHMTLRGMAPGGCAYSKLRKWKRLSRSPSSACVDLKRRAQMMNETKKADSITAVLRALSNKRSAVARLPLRLQPRMAMKLLRPSRPSEPRLRDNRSSHFDDSSDELPHTESPRSFDDAPARSMRRPSGIVVRKKGEGNSFGKPRGGFGSRGGFGKREGFGERGGFEKRPRFSGERDGFEKRPRFNGEGRGFEKRSGFEKRPSFGKRNSFGGEGRSFEKRGGFEKRPSFGERRPWLRKTPWLRKAPQLRRRRPQLRKTRWLRKTPQLSGEGRSFEKREGFEKRSSFGKRHGSGASAQLTRNVRVPRALPVSAAKAVDLKSVRAASENPRRIRRRGGFGSRSGRLVRKETLWRR